MTSPSMKVPALEGGQPVRDQPLIFGKPDLRHEDIDEVTACLRSGWLGTGPRVKQFEQAFAAYCQAKYAVALSSCTAAIQLALISLGIRGGDEVIVPTLSFVATASAVILAGAKPVLADVDPETGCLTVETALPQLSPKTKAIIPVHLYGRPCEMEPLLELAKEKKLLVIEDGATAIESRYKGFPVGTQTEAGCFSFYPNKTLTTGEGGMLVTNNQKLARKTQLRRGHGQDRDAYKRFGQQKFHLSLVSELGYKHNMTDIEAALGLHQLERLETNWAKREVIWQEYNQAFRHLPCQTSPKIPGHLRHAYHYYVLRLDLNQLKVSRDQIASALQAENIGVGVHYLPIHLHPYYQTQFGYQAGDLPEAERIGERVVSLPLSHTLTKADRSDVIKAVQKVLRYYTR